MLPTSSGYLLLVVNSVSVSFWTKLKMKAVKSSETCNLYTNLHSSILYCIDIFINTAVRTSNFVCTSWYIFLNSCKSKLWSKKLHVFVPNFGFLIQNYLKLTSEI
jgi:hypothetical protein